MFLLKQILHSLLIIMFAIFIWWIASFAYDHGSSAAWQFGTTLRSTAIIILLYWFIELKGIIDEKNKS